MTVLLVTIVLLMLAALSVLAVRCIRGDGGASPTPPARAEDEWSSDQPSHPYTHRIHS